MQAEVVDRGRQLPTVSQRMAIMFIIVYAIRPKHKRKATSVSFYAFLVTIKTEAEVVDDCGRKIPKVAPKDDKIVQ